MKQAAVYIVSNRLRGTLYVGVTSNLRLRIWQHKNHLVGGFTHKYNLSMLVWYEIYDSMYSAISREKAIKAWKRNWKIRLIERENPHWEDLYTRNF